jgi:hypothetical protein
VTYCVWLQRLAEIAHTLLKLIPYDPYTLGCTGLQRYMLEILPNTDWSQATTLSLHSCVRLALAWAGSCFPWDFILLGFSFCSAWVWLPGDAQQIAREPVSCDDSVSVGVPIKGPMFDRAFLRMQCGLTWDFIVSLGE